MPMADASRIFAPNSERRNAASFFRFGGAGLIFDASIYVFGIFTENDHVDVFRMLDGRAYAFKQLTGRMQAYRSKA